MPREGRGGGAEDGRGEGRGRGLGVGERSGKALGGQQYKRRGQQNETGPRAGTTDCFKYEKRNKEVK